MQTIDKFNSNLGTAILLLGPAGGGKTVTGCRLFPRTYVYVADLNFQSGIRYLEKIKEVSNIVGFDTGSVDETGKTIPVAARYDRLFRCVNEAAKSPDVDCIFLDSATFIEDYIKAKIVMAASDAMIRIANFEQWGNYLIAWKGLIMQLRMTGKKLIVSAHETKEKDESDGIYKYQIALDGQIKAKFPALFSDVLRCEVAEAAGKHTYMIRCLGNVRHELKNTYSLDALLPADEVVRRIRATLPKPA